MDQAAGIPLARGAVDGRSGVRVLRLRVAAQVSLLLRLLGGAALSVMWLA